MPCFHPRTVWRTPGLLTKNGKPRILFKKPASAFPVYFEQMLKTCHPSNLRKLKRELKRYQSKFPVEEFQIPGCKPKCIGCQEIYSKSWAVRAWHESMRHEENCFITLTFNDKFVPRQLEHRIWQLFMKRLRKAISQPVSFFMAGEYGSINFRPHFHACIFGFNFPDRVLWSVRDNVRLDVSNMLSKLWSDPDSGESLGFSSVGDVTFESAAYIARYVAKKVQRTAAQLDGRKPEYSKCSLKRPIGKDWFNAFKSSVFPDDSVTLQDGSKCKPPRYYDVLLDRETPDLLKLLKDKRKAKAAASPDATPARLKEREDVKKAQVSKLKRSL